MTVDVPTLLSPDSLRAVLPTGGKVAYRLPSLPVGGVRVLGDWNGDGVQTPGIFDDGQWQLWNQVQRVNNPPVTTTFGQPGDVPVTGDWNGDGITDLGVVRGAEWLLALGPVPAGGPPQVWRDLTFGDGNGEPVTGDWDGDGTDGIGTFRDILAEQFCVIDHGVHSIVATGFRDRTKILLAADGPIGVVALCLSEHRPPISADITALTKPCVSKSK